MAGCAREATVYFFLPSLLQSQAGFFARSFKEREKEKEVSVFVVCFIACIVVIVPHVIFDVFVFPGLSCL